MTDTMVRESIRSRRDAIARSLPIEAGSTERIRQLNALLLSTPVGICLHRARSYTEVFKQSEGVPAELRFAKAFARAVEDLPPVILDGELIIGSAACKGRACSYFPEIAGAWLRNEIDTLPKRVWDPIEMTPQQVEEVKEMNEWWRGRTLFDMWANACPPEIVNKVYGKSWASVNLMVTTNGYHFTPPWEALLAEGLQPYETRARDALQKVDRADPTQMGKEHFYEALLVVIGAAKDFSRKYARRARELAEREPDPRRSEELIAISQIVERVPYYGARSFHEAVQAVWSTITLLQLEGTGPVYTPGRVDQFLYPFYKRDVEEGRLTARQAQELIECLYLKLTGNVMLYPYESARSSPGYKQSHVISLGGVDVLGKDASNELSYLFLEAAESVRTIQPDIVLLCHPRETPHSLKLKAAELVALGLGVPKFISTETIKAELLNAGYSPEEARVGFVHGCTEPYGPGCKQYGHTAGCVINLPVALECALFDGRRRIPGQPGNGEQQGVPTGDARKFRDFDELMRAVRAQISQQIQDGHIGSSWVEWVQARAFPVLLQSALTDCCIERGLPAGAGGAKIYVGPGVVIGGGLATLADSLAAIKKLVYEERKLSMDDLLAAVEADFEGYENIRNMLVNQAPKFGNDIDYVDDIARAVFQFVNTEVGKCVTPLGNRNVASTSFPVSNVMQGTRTWATADGRKAGTPISNHVGPTQGLDVNGPIANVASVTKLDMDSHWGCTHNLYFVNIDDEVAMNRMLDVVDLFFERGGHHVQINCQDKEVYLDAQRHPERYRGLMVRVAGYVAYFVELPRELQDLIINRTSHLA